MVGLLRRIGKWFLGASEKVDRLDDEIRGEITAKAKRAFVAGLVLGGAVGAYLGHLV